MSAIKLKTKVIILANHNSKQILVTGPKRGKKRADKSRLVLVSFSLAEKVARVLPTNHRAQ